ncbi:efflux RND transporter periplasmic adaptor subunit [bacterium]|nr:efflux RND transporter periplasmic adaptor subunit [bacterium]
MAACVALTFLCGCEARRDASSRQAGPPEVLVAEAAVHTNLPLEHTWVGTLAGSTESKIKARVQGYVQKQVYSDGTVVKAGDVLFEIDPRPFAAALAQAKAEEASAEAKQVQTGLTEQRMVQLYKDNAVSEAERDKAVQDNAAAKAQVEAARAAVQDAEVNLAYTRVTAPITGIAGIALVHVGDLVSPASGDLTTMATVDPIKAVFYISEHEYLLSSETINAIAEGRDVPLPVEVDLVLADGAVFPHPGTLTAVDLQVSQQTGTVRIEALFPNPNNILRPGFYALTRIRTRVEALLVPQRAVMQMQGKTLVAVVTPSNTVTMRPVTAGDRYGAGWAILDGLKPGERVVVEGLQKVREGAPVVPMPYVPETNAPGAAAAAQAAQSAPAPR